MSTNDITGDEIKSKVNSKEYEEGYDRIFGKKKQHDAHCNLMFPATLGTKDDHCDCSLSKKQSRIDIVGQNGNDGLHYGEIDNEDTSS